MGRLASQDGDAGLHCEREGKAVGAAAFAAAPTARGVV